MSLNRFDLDVSYHSHYLNQLVRDIDNYTPYEYARSLLRMVNVTAPKVMLEPEFCKNILGPNEQSKIQLTGEYHADLNALINVLSNVRSKIGRIKAEILSNEGYFIDDGEGTYGNFHSEESIIKIIDRISNENDVPVIGGDS